MGFYNDMPPGRIAPQEVEHVADDFIQIKNHFLADSSLEERPDAPHDLSGLFAIADDSFSRLARLGQVRWMSREPVQAGVPIGYNSSKRLVNFLCNGRG